MGHDAPIKAGAAFPMASSQTRNWGFERPGSEMPRRRLTRAVVTVWMSSVLVPPRDARLSVPSVI